MSEREERPLSVGTQGPNAGRHGRRSEVGSDGSTRHVPVLLAQVVESFSHLDQFDRPYVFDGTLGGGGHAEAILQRFPRAQLIGTDQDPRALERVSRRLSPFQGRTTLLHRNFSELEEVVSDLSRTHPDWDRSFHAMLVDLGLSSDQLDDPERGFSFRGSSLDMRMNPDNERTAEFILNTYTEIELRNMFVRGGVRGVASALARSIVSRRPIHDAGTLRNIIDDVTAVIRARKRESGKGAASNSWAVAFQALRIEVNDELRHINRFLATVPDYLAPGGRLAAIAFHSAEDECVTRVMRKWGRPQILMRGHVAREPFGKLLTPKAIVETPDGIEANSRSRSARLRVFERSSGSAGLVESDRDTENGGSWSRGKLRKGGRQ